jgi:hypothetical protein
MPSSHTLARSPRHSRLIRAAAIALASCATAVATAATVDGRLFPTSTPVASQTSNFNDLRATKAAAMRALGYHHLARNRATQHPSRYNDLEANKASSIRALGRHLAEQRTSRFSRYDDLEANKARNQRASWLRTHGTNQPHRAHGN